MVGILCTIAGMSGGTASPTININNDYVFYRAPSGLQANAAYRLATDGLVYNGRGVTSSVVYLSSETWNTIPAAVADYEVRATAVSGDVPSGGTFGSWLTLGSTWTWTMVASPGNYRIGDILIEIRDAATLVVLTDATVTLEADAT